MCVDLLCTLAVCGSGVCVVGVHQRALAHVVVRGPERVGQRIRDRVIS